MPILAPRTRLHLLGFMREQVPALEQRAARDLRAAGQAHDGLSGHALAGSGLADDAERLSLVDLERHPADGLDDAVVGAERDVQVLDLK